MSALKRTGIGLAAFPAIVCAAFFVGRMGPVQPATSVHAARLQRIVSGEVADDSSVKNCVLAVVKGDGSMTWSGAAGIASDVDHVAMSKDTPIYIASVTKFFTAAVVMKLEERGLLSLDHKMANYLPRELIEGIHVHAGRDYSDQISLRDLLSHRSGIGDYYSDPAADGKSAFDLFLENPERHWTVDETIARARSLPPHFPPGTDTAYSDTNFQLLGKVIESVTGQPLHTVYDNLLFRPLGLDRTWLAGHRPDRLGSAGPPADVFLGERNITRVRSNGSYWADGGMVSTPIDMTRFLQALREGRVVRPDTLARMHRWHDWLPPFKYGYGTMYFSPPGPLGALSDLPPMWGHSGSTGSFLFYVESKDLYVAGSLNQTQSNAARFKLIREVIEAMQ